MSDAEKSAVAIVLIIISPIIIKIIKWFWLHPRVNTEKLKRQIEEVNALKQLLSSADELIQDLDIQTMEENNIRVKGITMHWTDSWGNDKSINFFIDGKDEASQQVIQLAKAIKKDSTKKLMKGVYKLPKRHGKSELTNIITIHGLE